MRTTLTFVLLFVAVAGPLALHAAFCVAGLPAVLLVERALSEGPAND
jgi:hypothetical protein